MKKVNVFSILFGVVICLFFGLVLLIYTGSKEEKKEQKNPITTTAKQDTFWIAPKSASVLDNIVLTPQEEVVSSPALESGIDGIDLKEKMTLSVRLPVTPKKAPASVAVVKKVTTATLVAKKAPAVAVVATPVVKKATSVAEAEKNIKKTLAYKSAESRYKRAISMKKDEKANEFLLEMEQLLGRQIAVHEIEVENLNLKKGGVVQKTSSGLIRVKHGIVPDEKNPKHLEIMKNIPGMRAAVEARSQIKGVRSNS